MLLSQGMDIVWLGQACFKIKGKSTTLIIDPYDPAATNLKLPKDLEAAIAIKTHDHKDHNNLQVVTGEPLEITGPGEYEIRGVTVLGVSTYHDKSNGQERGKNTIYNIEIEGINIVHLGDLGHVLTEDQVEEIGTCDILLIPVGGVYTIDAKDASEVVAQLEPKIVIPMHFKVPGLQYELDGVESFLKEMGAESVTPLAKLTITKDKLPTEMQVTVLNNQ